MNRWLSTVLTAATLATSAYVLAAPMETAQGTGIVKGIDAKAASVTLTHDPIPALKWPGMTMPFKLAKAELAKGLTVGQKVKFDLEMGQDHQIAITAISAVK